MRLPGISTTLNCSHQGYKILFGEEEVYVFLLPKSRTVVHDVAHLCLRFHIVAQQARLY